MLERLPLGYISVPEILPQLPSPSLASFALWSRPMSQEFASVRHGRHGSSLVPASLVPPRSFLAVHCIPLVSVVHPNPLPLAGEPRGRVSQVRPSPPPYGHRSLWPT